MSPLSKIIVLAWVGIGGLLGAHFGGVAAASGPATALLAYTGPLSFLSVFGGFTVLYALIGWRMGIGRREREQATIIRDKPGLANDPAALKRERRVRQKEARLQSAEQKALKKENKAERKEVKVSKNENKLERKREEIGMKKEQLRERERLGR